MYPDIPGLDRFAGPRSHTAAWPEDLDLTGKRVAMIGNGASAMQFGPEVQDQVASLTIFQRSPHWAAPFEHFRTPVPDPVRMLLREVPLYRAWYRVRLGWTFNDRICTAHCTRTRTGSIPSARSTPINDAHREYFTQYIVERARRPHRPARQGAADLPAVRQAHADGQRLVPHAAQPEGRAGRRADHRGQPSTPSSPTTARTYEADVLVIATGFDVLRFLTAFDVTVGRYGRTLREVWDDTDAQAYLGGLTVPDFPNLFVLYGPNTQPGHGGSRSFVIEMLVRYVIEHPARDDPQTASARWRSARTCTTPTTRRIDAAHEKMVWTHPGMSTYYRNDRGRVVVNYPYRNVDLFAATSHVDLADYHAEPSRRRVGVPG